ncbi:hypothetical protein LTR56_027561 [Elasticomyces elasticus]|nr:hypothetical protein LTR56_027561 [Elasticomyces elasticus]KAK3615813.1 hypothetical protein LTR22_027287 [Elasticomyces elasticus]KAK4897247.1 hypothetical protein LTR49_028023 [Elasticomyces elasticus]KAK5735324.1 hypothetical protein LTS12_026489 [Elasticomyces elasticus]
MATAVTSFQWFFWGFSLTSSHAAGRFIGNLDKIGFRNVLAQPSVSSPVIPDLLFAVHQRRSRRRSSMRGRPYTSLRYLHVHWTTVVYNTIACWTWNSSGWVHELGGLDFAGGTPVYISSGSAALASSFLLGKRTGYSTQPLNYRPRNVTHIVIVTVSLWVGWFGFNAGSALSANMRAVMAAVVTNLAACVRGVTW